MWRVCIDEERGEEGREVDEAAKQKMKGVPLPPPSSCTSTSLDAVHASRMSPYVHASRGSVLCGHEGWNGLVKRGGLVKKEGRHDFFSLSKICFSNEILLLQSS